MRNIDKPKTKNHFPTLGYLSCLALFNRMKDEPDVYEEILSKVIGKYIRKFADDDQSLDAPRVFYKGAYSRGHANSFPVFEKYAISAVASHALQKAVLCNALRGARVSVAKALIESIRQNGAEIDLYLLLFNTVIINCKESICFLVEEYNLNVNRVYNWKNDTVPKTLLRLAIIKGCDNSVIALVEKGARVDVPHTPFVGARVDVLQTPFVDSVMCFFSEYMKSQRLPHPLETPQQFESKEAVYFNIIETLLKNGATKHVNDPVFTANSLHLSIVVSKLPLVELLLQHGADCRIRNGFGNTAKEHASERVECYKRSGSDKLEVAVAEEIYKLVAHYEKKQNEVGCEI